MSEPNRVLLSAGWRMPLMVTALISLAAGIGMLVTDGDRKTGFLAAVGLAGMLFGMWLLWRVVWVLTTDLKITSTQVIATPKWMAHRTFNHAKVTNIHWRDNRTMLGLIVGYGDVVVEAEGAAPVIIPFVAWPKTFCDKATSILQHKTDSGMDAGDARTMAGIESDVAGQPPGKFQLKVDLPVAKYMGAVPPILRMLNHIYDAFRSHRDVDEGHVTRTFDWGGTYIWTPCDCELAANIWFAPSGIHKYAQPYVRLERRFTGNTDSWATMYIHRFGGGYGCIFGNGDKLYYATGNEEHARLIRSADGRGKMNDIQVTQDRRLIVMRCSDYSIVSLNLDTGLEEQVILTGEDMVDRYGLLRSRQTLLDSPQSESKYICIHSEAMANDGKYLAEPGSVLLISLRNYRSLYHRTVHGIRKISAHPKGNWMAILGRDLTLLSIPDLEVLESHDLPLPRRTDHTSAGQGLSFSSCGKYLAVSYAINGEVEVRDARTLEILHVFDEGDMAPERDLAWDSSGRYLACRFKSSHTPVTSRVTVWDMTNRLRVLQTESKHRVNDFKWSPDSTALACLVDNERIQVFDCVK